MSNPTLILSKVMKNGAPAIMLMVRYATPELRTMLDGLGVTPDCTLSNCRTIVCSTPAELDTVRNPLMPLFGHKGEWLGKAVA
jgi:hypothetical protein